MENARNTKVDKDNGNNQNATSQSDLKWSESKQTQNESKYDSHSEVKPHQKTIVSTDAKPDRVSNNNRDTTSNKMVNEDFQGNEEVDKSSKPFPKSRSSSFPSLL